MLDVWKTARFRHGFSDWLLKKVKRDCLWSSHLTLTKSMPINTSEKVKAFRKSHMVLSCLTSAGSFITPDFVGTIPLDSVRFRRLRPTDSTTIFDQADDYQEKASLSVSEQVPHEKSRSSSRKSAAGTVPTVFGSSAGHSLGKPQRDCVSETSLLSKNTTESYEEDRFRTWSVSIFMHPELMDRYKDSQTCSLFVSRMMMSKIFDVRWYQAQLSADEPLSDKVLEGLQKSKLNDSVQLQTVLALYDPETVRNKKQTSYSRFKTSLRLCFDQKMRSRNLKARNDMIHGGVVTRSRKDNKANVERKVRDCWQWQATGQCSKGDSCGFHHGVRASGNGSELLKQKERTSSPAPKSKATPDGKGKSSDEKDGKSFDKRNKIHVNGEIVPICRVVYRHPPSVRTTFHK